MKKRIVEQTVRVSDLYDPSNLYSKRWIVEEETKDGNWEICKYTDSAFEQRYAIFYDLDEAIALFNGSFGKLEERVIELVDFPEEVALESKECRKESLKRGDFIAVDNGERVSSVYLVSQVDGDKVIVNDPYRSSFELDQKCRKATEEEEKWYCHINEKYWNLAQIDRRKCLVFKNGVPLCLEHDEEAYLHNSYKTKK